MSGLFKSKKTTTSSAKSNTNETATTTPFSGEALNNYNDYVTGAQNNYNSVNSNINSLIGSGAFKPDTSKMDTAYAGLAGTNTTNLTNLATGSYNPSANADWVASEKAIADNAKLGWGDIQDQVNRNIIGTGMANGSGHQSAMYKAGTNFESQLASDSANRWQDQYNQNVNNSLQAQQQLQSFYTTLEKMGVDYANLSESEINTLLSAYTAQNNALNSWGSAVEMGSNPTVTGTSSTTSSGKNTTTSTPSPFSMISSVFGAMNGAGGK